MVNSSFGFNSFSKTHLNLLQCGGEVLGSGSTKGEEIQEAGVWRELRVQGRYQVGLFRGGFEAALDN